MSLSFRQSQRNIYHFAFYMLLSTSPMALFQLQLMRQPLFHPLGQSHFLEAMEDIELFMETQSLRPRLLTQWVK
jgi:hypothetical protein